MAGGRLEVLHEPGGHICAGRLEFTYTGKAAAAFMHEARRTSGPLLFWNTHSSADISRWVEAGGG